MDVFIKQAIKTHIENTECIKCLHFPVCSRIMGGMNLKRCADYSPSTNARCPVCSGEQIIRQDCDNGYYVEVDRKQQEMSIWFQDECLAVFSIDHCPTCGKELNGGNIND